ncbi:uncharacterized protein LOC142059441 [Phalacrocorax aristotelis]|uniref:uncharacterized protein LOC142059441 n=1 Tax=Phalacrocorax aristotelis TaxID=126867 RepID=UPI003F4C02B6
MEDGAVSRWWASLKMATGSAGGQAGELSRKRCRMQASEGRRRMPTRGPRGCAPAAFGPGCAFEMMKRHLALGGPMQWAACALVLLKDGWTETLGPLKAKAALVGLSRGVPTRDRDLRRGSAVAVHAGDLFGIGLAGAEGGVVQGDGGRRCQQVVGEPQDGNRICWRPGRCRTQASEGRRRVPTRGPRGCAPAAFGPGCAFEGPQGRTTVRVGHGHRANDEEAAGDWRSAMCLPFSRKGRGRLSAP